LHQHRKLHHADGSSPADNGLAPAAMASAEASVSRRPVRVLSAVSLGACGVCLAILGRLVAPAATGLGDVLLALGLIATALALGLLAQESRVPAAGHAGAGAGGDERVTRARRDSIDDRIETLADAKWQLSERERGYRDLLDAQEDVIARRNAAGRITFVNRAFRRVFGLAAADTPDSAFRVHVLASEAPLPGDAAHRIEQVETAAGPRWFAWSEHDVPGHGGRGRETQIVGRDVTAERQHAAALADARDQAEAASRAKSRFLAAMSHEIRTPMNGILGMAELLRETQPTGEQQSYVEAIDQSAKTLLELIDEILDFSKIEAGRLALRCEPFAIEATVQSVVELMATAAHEKGLEIAWTLEPEVPRLLLGDEMRVRQILLNLVSNAVKFTERGGVQVAVYCAAGDGDEGPALVAIEVMDTGIGLAREAADTLFAEFEQVEQRHCGAGGTGLGLAISRRLARAMGGDIVVASQPRLGSTFTATLALAAAAGPAHPAGGRSVVTADLAGRRVLLAFGRLIERRALAIMLRHAGAIVDEASDARAEAELAAARRRGDSYDLMVIDAEDGAEEAAEGLAEARALASEPGKGPRGIVLVDACGRRGLGPFRAAGFDGYVVRPVRPRALAARLSAVSAERVEGGGAKPLDGHDRSLATGDRSDGEPRSLAPRAHVLVAEDNPINARLAETMLTRAGCTVLVVADGAEAVRQVEAGRDGAIAPFDLVLMDMHMPELDGLAATRRLKAAAYTTLPDGRVRLALPPIVAVTANAFEEDRQTCRDAGMDDYVAKPFTRADIEAVLAKWVRRGG